MFYFLNKDKSTLLKRTRTYMLFCNKTRVPMFYFLNKDKSTLLTILFNYIY